MRKLNTEIWPIDTREHGLTWHQNGYASLTGDLLHWYHELDNMFLSWASSDRFTAAEHQFPNLIAREDLDRIDYFESFGHLATCVESSDCVLTPAACYHFYASMKNQELENSVVLTTRANCFRREKMYFPLMRQWTFGMREIVCIGTEHDVIEFLEHYKQLLREYFDERGLPVTFEQATDPFFTPENNPKYVMQLIDPVKIEMVFTKPGCEVAVGSFNKHRTTFGDAFGITINGEPAHSACVAFGIERWIHMHLMSCQIDLNKPITQWETQR